MLFVYIPEFGHHFQRAHQRRGRHQGDIVFPGLVEHVRIFGHGGQQGAFGIDKHQRIVRLYFVAGFLEFFVILFGRKVAYGFFHVLDVRVQQGGLFVGVLFVVIIHIMVKNGFGIHHNPTVRRQGNLYVHAFAFFGHLFKIIQPALEARAVQNMAQGFLAPAAAHDGLAFNGVGQADGALVHFFGGFNHIGQALFQAGLLFRSDALHIVYFFNKCFQLQGQRF